jgi:hypothetical protein
LQGTEGKDSRIRQSKSAEKWMEDYGNKLGYVLSNESFVDSGKSGYKGKHIEKDEYGKAKGELVKFIERVENGSIKSDSILLVDDFSRFSRLEPSQSLTLFTSVMALGIGLVFTGSHEKQIINNDFIKSNPHILYFIIGEMIRSFTESEETSRKVKRAKQDKKERIKSGEVMINEHLPKYLTYIPITKFNGKYIFNDKVALVREMIAGVQAGKSLFSIADGFNQRNIKTFRRESVWTGKTIKQILSNPILTGEYMGIKDYVPAVMDKDTFDGICKIINGKSMKRGNKGKIINIFR